MNRTLIQTLLTALLLLTAITVVPASVSRAQGAAFGVSPSLLELEAKPGADGEVTITVANTGDVAITAISGVAPIPSADPSRSAETWLTVEPASLALEPGNEGLLKVTIAVPDDLQTGGYYAYVTVTGGQEGDATGANTAAIQGQLAVPFLITVNGDGELDRAVAIDRFAPVLQPDGRIGFAAAIRNTGNIHSSPTGSVTVTLENGEAYGSLDFVQSTPLLPGAERLLTTQGTLPVQDGASYMATIEIGGTNIESATLDAAFTMDPPAVLLGGLTICENLDRGPSVTATVENPSTLGVMGMIDVSVQAADGSAAGQAMVEQPPVLWPGEATTLTTDIQERLVSGDYVLIVTLTPAIGEPITAELPFAIGGTGPTTAPICQAPATPDTNG